MHAETKPLNRITHFCGWCSHAGGYAGAGPHDCPGCHQTLLPRSPEADVDRIFAAAFSRPRQPRSDAYREGVRACLRLRLVGVRLHCGHPAGTPQADAFFAGVEEGNALWQAHLDVLRRAG